jgi:hypothetical protein
VSLASVAALAAATGVHAAAPAGSGATTATGATTTTAAAPKSRLNERLATRILLARPKVAGWLRRYPAANVTTTATLADGIWQVNVFYAPAGEIASGKVADATGQVTEAFTGPQVAWGMARGGTGFGGKKINSLRVWLVFSVAFLLGLVDWRRPLSPRTADLLALISFLPSLWLFNNGHIFASMSLIYPGFTWLIARCLWIARRDRGSGGPVIWPTWALLAATIVLAGYRIEINVEHSDTIDVSLSGVIGADRIAHFQSPYGHFPVEDGRPACGPADSSGEIRDHIQTNGRCEAADALGDTYGPVSYEAYLPGYLALGWSGKWDTLPAAHATPVVWDILAMIGLLLVGLRFGGPRLGATLVFAWAAWPLGAYSMANNTNDLIEPALLIWGFYFVTAPFKRGLFAALSGWTKFASLLVAPLWSGYPDAALVRLRLRFLGGFAAGSALAFSVVLFERSPVHNLVVFFHHTIGYQYGRSAPFSIWDWRQYHARGIPDLHWVQRVLQVALVSGALVLARWPRHRSPLRLAAFTGALLVGFEAILTYWSFSYLVWFFPFVVYAVVATPARFEPPLSLIKELPEIE